MSRNISRKKRIPAVVVASALVLGGGSAAFAYWTSTGTGVGAAGTGASSTAFTVASTAATGGALSPGGPIQTVPFTVTNPGTGVQNLASVVVSVANANGTPWTAVPDCSKDDFSVGTPTITYGAIDPSGVKSGTVTVTMVNNTTKNQNACQGVDVPLYFVAS